MLDFEGDVCPNCRHTLRGDECPSCGWVRQHVEGERPPYDPGADIPGIHGG